MQIAGTEKYKRTAQAANFKPDYVQTARRALRQIN